MKLLNKEIICYFDGYNIKDNYDTCVSSYQDDKSFSQNKFEILSEEDEEIDIQSIEEYKTQYTERCIDKEVRHKINELIKAVKKLDNLHRPVNAGVVVKESENR